jgi:hypothetical protein
LYLRTMHPRTIEQSRDVVNVEDRCCGRGVVFAVTITCPATGNKVSTGIRIRGSSWNSDPAFQGYIRCPACGADHEWSTSDVTLSDDIEIARLARLLADKPG